MGLSVENQPPTLVVMGVSGVGKTTVARLLAERLGLPYAEADDFHPPANIAKMAAGIPLDDEDRQPWLLALADWLGGRVAAGTGGVVACSALKRRYRDTLRSQAPATRFLHLTGDQALIRSRLAERSGHFMPASLLDSQYAALEPLQADEPGLELDVAQGPSDLADHAARLLIPHHPRPVNGDSA
ncbi:gluconokinase [Kitasatospora sp. CMC57]|uniref:Gluconokinase n=1 Tax=Kitasatospora sp. CMC57 TaxID=3231513 RepID=A0AB33K4M8_9ACTN